MNPGDVLDGRYQIIQRLGAGGMGEVYKATHILLGATRVIKVVHPNISTNADARERFLREARAATKVQHPNVATVHDFASLPDGSHYMVWEFIDGENLAQRLRTRGPIPPKNAIRIGIQALRGLDAIHRAGIIHRDISPENLMIAHADDTVKIIDLGVAKIEEDAGAVSQTKTGIFVGKLRYASPEQLGFLPDGEKVDGRADLYGMAMVIVELLTGRPPYEATSPHEYFIIHAREKTLNTVELPRELPGSAALKQVMEKALSRDRNERYANAGEFVAALEEIEKTLPDPRAMPTMALPLDGDETMRIPSKDVDTLHRPTVRTNAPPLPEPPPAAPTIRTPLPMPGEATAFNHDGAPSPVPPPPPPAAMPLLSVPAAKTRSGIHPLWIIGLVVFALMLTGAVLLLPRVKKTIAQFTSSATTTTGTTPPVITDTHATSTTLTDTTAVNDPTVTSGTAGTTVAITDLPPGITTTAPPLSDTSQPAVVLSTTRGPVVQKPADEQRDIVKKADEAGDDDRGGVATYVEGGDYARNRRALAVLRRHLRGASSIGLAGGGLQFSRAMRSVLPDMEFDSESDYIVHFNGTGRQSRNGLGSVTKGDREIFRYNSAYGTSPEGFAAVIAEAIN